MRSRFARRAAIMLALAASPAAAFDLDNMSDAEKAAFGAQIRAYLMENPQVIMEAVSVLEQRQADAQRQSDADLIKSHQEALFNDPNSWVGGNPDGDITVVEFMDYRCGYCRKAAPEVADLLESDGNIRFIVKEFPILGEESVTLSRFAIAVLQVAGAEAYASAHDKLIALKAPPTDAVLRKLADDLGVETDKVMTAMSSDDVSKVIAENHKLGQQMGISGTPSFVFQDEMVRGYVPLDSMTDLVAELRAR